MKRKILCLFLALILFLGSCASPEEIPSPEIPAAPPRETALGILAALGTERWEELSGNDAAFYLTELYGLPEGVWEDAAIVRAGGAEALEIAVILLSEQADAEAVLASLEAYRDERQGDFSGYAPDQAEIVAGSRAVLWGTCAALLICGDPDTAEEAFAALVSGEQEPPETDSDPEAGEAGSPKPALNKEAETEPSREAQIIQENGRYPFQAPNKEDMSLYDTANILAVWNGKEAKLTEEEQEILDAASAVLAEIVTADMDDYEKEQAVYGWVTENVAYDQAHYDPILGAPRASYTPYNPLIGGKGVCLGFASAFQLLLDMCGVECITVVGAARNSREDHAWNMVKLGGNWYCADPTWDCGLAPGNWRFFNITSERMAQSGHQWNYGAVPEAEAADQGKNAIKH